MARDFRSIKAWERAHRLTLEVYRATSGFPSDERFGLVSQMRRACSSIPTNIAEGCGRNTETELARFIDIATGSASEVEYQLLLARDLGYLPNDQHHSLSSEVVEIRKMLLAFNKALRTNRS
ncbi:MAG: four helix bundle protein [Proteobacteria bacterium]|nr:four helix bundle protein [Pseudomonadota bacterium]